MVDLHHTDTFCSGTQWYASSYNTFFPDIKKINITLLWNLSKETNLLGQLKSVE